MDEISVLHRYPMARRGVLTGGFTAGLTLATARVEAQTIETDAHGLVTGEVDVPTADGHMPAYFARPDGPGPFALVLVNEEIFGVHHYIKDVCRRLAKLGKMAVALDIYARSGDLGKIADIKTIFRIVSETPDAQMLSDLDAAVVWAEAHGGDPKRLGVLGFCRGGRATWLYAEHNRSLRAAVAFYGQVNTPTTPVQPDTALELAGYLHCPLLGLYGGKDPSIKRADVEAAAARARAAGQTVEIVYYPDAGHGFHADYRPSYVAKDAKDAWARAMGWFQTYGVA
ncbi:MAG: dienelactone hydrolase family protein [Rhodospirillales bacterium]|jgi:carboxymethylenebutenolidase|nr:dienelactone hydrolase family protein [Rhodospirillales bacterium]